MAPDGSDPVNLTRRPSADDGRWSVAWSHDGRSLAYASSGFAPTQTQPIVLEDLAIAGALLVAAAFAIGAMVAVSIGLPFGAVTIVLAVGALFAAIVGDGWRFIPALVLIGLLIDLVLTRIPRLHRRRVAAILTPAGLVLGYGLTLLAVGSLSWTTTLLIGVGIAAGLIGWILATVLPVASQREGPPATT